MELLDMLTRIRNELARADVSSVATGNHEVERMLDSIAENAVNLRGVVGYGRGNTRAERLLKRVRRALGYTYP